MVSAKQLSKLKELQRLRCERDKHALGQAVSETLTASSEEEHARNELGKCLGELNQKAREATLDFDRFRVLANQASDLDTQTRAASERREACVASESEARLNWNRSDQQCQMLSKQIASQTRREGRRADDKAAKDHLNRYAQKRSSTQ